MPSPAVSPTRNTHQSVKSTFTVSTGFWGCSSLPISHYCQKLATPVLPFQFRVLAVCSRAFLYHDVSLLRDEKRVDTEERNILAYHFSRIVGKEAISKDNSRTGTEGGTDLLTSMTILSGVIFILKDEETGSGQGHPVSKK